MPKTTVDKRISTSERVIEAARDLFLRDGYSNTNLESVATLAGVTKPTVYAHFESKKGLLLAVTAAQAKSNADKMMSSLSPTGNIEADLLKFGKMFLTTAMSEEANCWHRLSLAESRDHPEIGDAVYASGPARVIKAVTDFIAGEIEAGRLDCDDSEVAAEQFIGLLAGVNPVRMMTGQSPPSKAKLNRSCEKAVETFLAAFATDAS